MSKTVISVENLSKYYRLGVIGGGTLRDDVDRWWAKLRGKPDPLLEFAKLHQANTEDNYIWALRDINLAVEEGEILGIIGKNGAGKSTLLKILSRITAPTSGRAIIKGRVGSLLEVGTGFHPELTGRENIFLNGTILGMRKWEVSKKMEEIVAFAEVENFVDTPVKRYSSGMMVRLAFAVAAHLEPEILIVDEVLAVGDAAFQRKCLGKMEDVSQHGRTILFVSHNMVALQNLCPNAVWLSDGQIVHQGSSSTVVAEYLSTQSTSDTERVWPELETAPGNKKVKLQRLWVESDTDNGTIARELPIRIGVEYWKPDPNTSLHITLHVSVDQQVVAFATGSCDDSSWHNEALGHSGTIRSICHIPANLLNTGQHRIKILVVEDRSRVIYKMDDGLLFDVIETEARGGAWYGKRTGVVRPHLQWTNLHIGGQSREVG